MAMPIYFITDAKELSHSEEYKSAKAMQQKFTDSEVKPFEIEIKGKLFGTTTVVTKSETAPQEIILLAHTDNERPPQTMGDKSPKQLAEDFSNIIPKNQRAQVQDIFLISCEAGMGDPSLAQKLASEMQKQGFLKVNIHAVAHPVGSLIGGGVEVTHRAGDITGGTVGQVNGYFYGDLDSQNYHLIKEKKVKDRTSEEKEFINTFDSRNVVIVNLVTDMEEMRLPYNTFTPEGPKARISADVAVALSFFKNKKDGIINRNRGNETDESREIDRLILELQLESELTHAGIINKIDMAIASRPDNMITNFINPDSIKIHLKHYKNQLNDKLNHVNQAKTQQNPNDSMQVSPSPLHKKNNHSNIKKAVSDLRNSSKETCSLDDNVKQSLTEYLSQRTIEKESGLAFFIVMTPYYLFLDFTNGHYGADSAEGHFDPAGREHKISAAEKLLNEDLKPFSGYTQEEQLAFSSGKLGSICTGISFPAPDRHCHLSMK